MKRLTAIIILVMALLGTMTVAVAMAAEEAPKDPITMTFPADNNKYAPIMFEHHERHLGLKDGCVACHHKWDGAGAITGCRVEGCHSDISKENKRQPTSYDSAFHSKGTTNSCVGCHKEMLKSGEGPKAPQKCNDCHSKK